MNGIAVEGVSSMTYDIGSGIGAGMGNAAVSIKRKSSSSNKRVTQSKNQKKSKKKQLNYNPREISNQIVRAVKAESASFVLARAKTKLSVLKRCIGTGQYEERELLAAVAHAQRMVNCAKLKVKNLKEEERQGHDNEREQADNRRQKKNEIKRKVSQKKQELEHKMEQEKMQLIRKEKMQRRELIRKQRMHRNEELSKIQEADMKYLKDKMGHSASSQENYSGVSLELSSAAMGLQEIQLSEHAMELAEKQLEQEIEIQVEMQMQAAGISAAVCSSVDTGGIQEPISADSAVPAATIDISI